MSINQLIEISRRSFRSLNGAMNTVSQNIANVNTEGYARRRVTLQADSIASPGIIMPTPRGTATGSGVSIQSYERVEQSTMPSYERTMSDSEIDDLVAYLFTLRKEI